MLRYLALAALVLLGAAPSTVTPSPSPLPTYPPPEISATAAFHQAFRDAFKRNFIGSCLTHAIGVAADKALAYCTCADERTEKRYNDKELYDLSAGRMDVKAALGDVMRECAASVGVPLKP